MEGFDKHPSYRTYKGGSNDAERRDLQNGVWRKEGGCHDIRKCGIEHTSVPMGKSDAL